MAGLERADSGYPFTAQELGCAEIRFETDALIANVGSHQGQDGGTVIVGTGSVDILTLGSTIKRIGGHGFPVSDQGSRAYIGLQCVRAVLNAFDGLVAESGFTRTVFDHLGGSRARLYAWLEQATPTEFAALAPVAAEFALAKDANATLVLEDAANQIADMLISLRDAGAPRVALQGGLAKSIRRWVPGDVCRWLAGPLGDPLSGALILANQMFSSSEILQDAPSY